MKIFTLLLVLLFSLFANSQTNFTIGVGNTTNTGTTYPAAIPDFYEGNHSQYLYLASEMQAIGMTAGTINSIKFNVTALNSFTGTVPQYSISIVSTTIVSLASNSWESLFQSSNYGPVDYVPTVGVNTFIFSTPFLWNGIDNIVIDICNGDPLNGSSGVNDYSYNVSTPATVGLTFNGSHTYRANNLGNLCSAPATNNLAKQTTRPDIIFSFTYNAVCSGTPVGGNTVSNKDTVCANEGFNVYTSASSTGSGMSYQWQKSTDGINYDTIAGANSFAYNNIAGVSVSSYYRRKITCSGVSSFSVPKYVYVRPFYQCYCSPKTNIGLHILSTLTIDSIAIIGATANYKNVHIGSNAAPSFGYASFTDTTASVIPVLQQATPYILSVATNATPINTAIWIDWNHNTLFDSSEYQIIHFATDSTHADSVIDVPANAQIGFTMMRIRTSKTAFNYSNACTLFNDGETEDYLFKVVAGFPCSGVPIAGNTVSSVATICPNKPFSLSVAGATDGVVIAYQWQSSSSCGSTFTDIVGATNKTLYVYGITTNTSYRRKITCGANSVFSAPVCVTMNPLYDCFCSPLNGNTLQYTTNNPPSNPSIDSVSITGNGVNYFNSNVGFNVSPYAYSIYDDTALAPHLAQSTAYTLTISTSIYPNAVGVWIDWNANGVYEASEYQPITFTAPPVSATTASILITPPTTVLGFIGMRVRSNAGFLTTEACRAWTSGETEDYVLKIVAGTACTGTPIGGTTEATTSTVCHYDAIFLSVSGATVNLVGLTHQWQDSTAGGAWINSSMKTALNDTTSQVLAKYYRRQTTCTLSGLSNFSIPVFVNLNTPTYAAIPFAESFETNWIDGCGASGSRSIPNKSWRNNPTTTNQSWRRDDDGISANWTANSYSAYTPTASAGSHSARFHTSQAQGFPEGSLDLFLDCSATVFVKNLSFDYINTNGNDSLRIYLSTDAGLTFTKIAKYDVTSGGWTNRSINFNSNAALTVLRFKASADFGVSDIGIDNITITNTLLPYTAIQFIGEKVNNKNQLKWIVTNETDAKGYELQRSENGVTFNDVAFILSKANGSSGVHLEYLFIDKNAISNNVFYRLNQIAKDGSSQYSNTVLIKGIKINDIVLSSLYPNPAKDFVNITIASPSNKKVFLVITNMLGKQMLKQNELLKQGDNFIGIKTNKLNAGNYFINVVDTDGNKSSAINFIKE